MRPSRELLEYYRKKIGEYDIEREDIMKKIDKFKCALDDQVSDSNDLVGGAKNEPFLDDICQQFYFSEYRKVIFVANLKSKWVKFGLKV